MNAPRDQAQRTRFISELEQNFSVVASAGSGKTRAITDRIVAMARHERALEWLPTLVVVTYTNRAAAEMQQRARQSIIEADVRPEVLAAFGRAFFGTIHSLCLRLLRQHGHHLGLPGQLEHLDEGNDAALWREFLQQHTTLGGALDDAQRRALLRLTPARMLMELGRKGASVPPMPPPGPLPALDFSAIHAFVPDGRSRNPVTRSREALQRWEEAWKGDDFAGPPPGCKSTPLRPAWEAALAPLRAWVRQAAQHVAAETARSYRDFRLRHGRMTFADQVALAAALLRQPEAAQRIRAKNYRVILDEAQDTDPTQFDVLLDLARPPEATGAWPGDVSSPPRAGHFCMVGDFQQSIYGSRADLPHYLRIHEALQESGAGEALKFSVTFRLDEAGIRWVNATFPPVLNGLDGQVPFVELSARPAVLPGQVVRLDLGQLPDIGEWSDRQKAYWEAEQLAHWLHAQGLDKLRASSWSEVAILCPRTRWLPALRTALQRAGLKAQVQSERAIRGDSPACAWFTALVVALAEPRNGFEIVGVLREVFGHSDQELADFAQADGSRFRLTTPSLRGGPVAKTLNLLVELRERIAGWALFSAMEEMVRVTELRERLLVLPPDDFSELAEELDNLLTEAAAAEAVGATLETFAADLRTGFTAVREVRAAMPSAVQIISGHKAKGSEWDAVIVPFFARSVTAKPPPYPYMLRDPRTREFVAILTGHDLDSDLKDARNKQATQELERVLYVALTRARHTLVLADDRTLFAGADGLPKNAQARLLRCAPGDLHAPLFQTLPESVSACPATQGAKDARSAARARAQLVPSLPEWKSTTLALGRERAVRFIKRNPSALAEAARADADPAAPQEAARRWPVGPNAGQLYGIWWHEFVERLDWHAPAEAWDAVFAVALLDSPDPALSRREWDLLRQQLTTDSPLARLLLKPGVIIQIEMPFLWAMSSDECLEGIIDLAVFDPEVGQWLLLDWKTNRASVKELPQLRAHYLLQLSAYWKALTEMLGAPVAAGLYATATGQWLPYESSALSEAWESLRRRPEVLAQVLQPEETPIPVE